ncbi:MAG: gliding motility-associated C-terminal domain-containing protein [Ferruginibacter sp.]
MKKFLLFIIAFLSFFFSFSQQHWNNKIWYYGTYCGLDFNTTPPTMLLNSAMGASEGCATMCDVNGNLLFYTEGRTVWNRNHQAMPNGTGLHAHPSSTQAALIVPLPGSDHIYYIFTTWGLNSSFVYPVSYSIVDMTLNGGLGDVTVKNTGIGVYGTEKLAATLQGNGTDYWIITTNVFTASFHAYALTASGFNPVPVISHVGNTPPQADLVGYLTVSPNGSKLAIANRSMSPALLCDFDNNSGMVANPIELVSDSLTYGAAFSEDNSKLYIMQQYMSKLRQYDLLAGSPTAIQNSVQLIFSLTPPLDGAAIMLAPNKKIYLVNYRTENLSVIDQPNLPGAACNYIQNAFIFPYHHDSAFGLPNNIYYPPPPPGCPQQIYSSHNVSICPGQTFTMPSGTVLSTSGTFQDTLRNVAHCDSIITIVNLLLVNPLYLNTTAHICVGQTYHLPSGATFTLPGIYQDTMRSVHGCDSVITTLTLTVFPSNPTYNFIDAHICSGQQYHLPSGQVVYNTGAYHDTIRNVNGCDSIITNVNLNVTGISYNQMSAHICPGQTYTLPSGVVVSTQGAYYYDTIKTVYGCDSIRFLVYVYVQNVNHVYTQPKICAGQQYILPSGSIISNPGFYLDTLRSIYACDSIIYHVTLSTLVPVYPPNITAQICSGQSYHLPSGTIVNTAGTYSDTIRAVGGCDSIIRTIILSVTPASLVTTAAQICSGQTYSLPSGHIVNTAGVYLDTLRSVAACDSIITTVTLSVIPGSYVNTAVQICSGQTYTLPSGTIISTAGIYYIDTLRSVTGCDSIIHTVTLSVFPVSHTNMAAQICSGQTYHLPSGASVNTTGVYVDTIRSVNTCDSIITTVTLSVVVANIVSTTAQICTGQTYTLPSGTIINTAGVYTDTLRSVIGCDSIISTTTLSVVLSSHVNTNVLICSGQTYTLPSGTIVSTAGVYYTDTLRSIAGCDSVIHSTTVSVSPVNHATATANICAGQTYTLPSGIVVNTPGVYPDTVRSVNSCDSIITTVTLSVLTAGNVNTAVEICSNQTYTLPSGNVVGTAGVYIDTLRSVGGCDSVITNTTLSVFPVSHVNSTIQICFGQSYHLPSGTIVNTTGIYIDTLRSIAGCDSVITSTNLSVLTASHVNTAVQLCSNQTYTLPSGTVVSAAGNYIDTVKSVIGCDSIITHLALSVFPVQNLNTEVHICSNETYHLPSGTLVSTTGVYIDTLRNVASCDSIIDTIHLFVNDISSTHITDSIFAGQVYTLPSGLVVSAAGVYESVLLNSVGCDSVITTTLKLKQQIAECITLKNAFTPNGDGINDYWVLYRYNCFRRLEVNVYNRYGSLVYHSNDYKNDWAGKYKNKELPDGTYYYIIKVISFDGKEHLFRDNLTILR